MQRVVLIFGGILGAILCINMFYMVNMVYSNPGFVGNDVLGYAAMVVVFSLCFFGIRNYRNKHLNGHISFGKAFKVGALIALIASTMYVVGWLFYYYLAVPDFIERYSEHVILCEQQKGSSAAEIAAKSTEMQQFSKMYQNPFFVVLITYSEVLPVGLLVALVSALVLKRKPQPAKI